MPRSRKNKETPRRQLRPQDTFRITTPRVDVAAHPVDAIVNPVHQRIQEFTGTAYLPPQAPLRRPAPINPANYNMKGRYIRPPGLPTAVEPDPLIPILQFAGNALPAAYNIYEDAMKQKGQEAFEEGEDRPDPWYDIANIAADTYDSAKAGAEYRTNYIPAAEKFKAENPDLSPEELKAGLDSIAADMGVGKSRAYRNVLNMNVVGYNSKLVAQRSVELVKKAQTDFLDNITTNAMGRFNNILETAETPEEAAQMQREAITEWQKDALTLGIPNARERVSAAAVKAAHLNALQNLDGIGDPMEQVFKFAFEKDSAGNVSIMETAVAADVFDAVNHIDRQIGLKEAREEKATADIKAQTYEDLSGRTLAFYMGKSQESGEALREEIFAKVQDRTLGYTQGKSLIKAVEERMYGFTGVEDMYFVKRAQEALLMGDPDNYLEGGDVIDAKIANGTLSWDTGFKLKSGYMRLSSAWAGQYQDKLKNMFEADAFINHVGDVEHNYTRRQIAVEIFNQKLLEAEGIDDLKTIKEAYKETVQEVKSLGDSFEKMDTNRVLDFLAEGKWSEKSAASALSMMTGRLFTEEDVIRTMERRSEMMERILMNQPSTVQPPDTFNLHEQPSKANTTEPLQREPFQMDLGDVGAAVGIYADKGIRSAIEFVKQSPELMRQVANFAIQNRMSTEQAIYELLKWAYSGNTEERRETYQREED